MSSVEYGLACSGDMEMDYAVFGEGKQPLVIVPGLSLGAIMKVAEAVEDSFAIFAGEYRVYLFDRRRNLKPGMTCLDLAEDMALALQALDLKKVSLYGVSQGGMICQCLAAYHPELVGAMAVCATSARISDANERASGEWIRLAEAGDVSHLIPAIVDKLYSKAVLEKYRDTIIASFGEISALELERFVLQAKATSNFSIYEELYRVSCPVLAIGAKGDRILDPEATSELAQAVHGEIYMYGEEYGHGVYDEAPDLKPRLKYFFDQYR